ncbi:MAG: hypothetical protein Q9172_001459 [Xanthocarpia lactea]
MNLPAVPPVIRKDQIMKPLYILLLLSSPIAAIPTVLNFDNLPTPHGLTSLPSPYHNLTFTNAAVFSPRSPALADIITPNDHNCAISTPNAIIGSRDEEGGKGLRFETASNATNSTTSFALKQFWVKPMDFPAPGSVKVTVSGYRRVRTPDFKWHVDFPSGYHLPFLVKIEEYSGREWTRLRAVEVVADYGEQALDWEVCLDDLAVEFDDEGGQMEGEAETGRTAGCDGRQGASKALIEI